MKNALTLLMVLCSFHYCQATESASLKGKIIDKKTNEPLPGATIYIPDLKTGTAADLDGNYELKNLPTKKLLLQVKCVGYATIIETVDLTSSNQKDFFLESTVIEGKEVVITGSAISSENNRTSVVIQSISRRDLQQHATNNIIDAIAHVPGVSQISTGNAISKPVIRGLSYNRVVTLNEGVRQEGQQWGDEHGIEIDENSPDKIEILKGPASLLYGSDAMGGVINFLEPLPPPDHSWDGEFSSKYSTNGNTTNNSLMLQGNYNGFCGRIRASYKDAGPYSTPVGKVYNSSFKEKDLNGLVGLNRSWGYSHLHFSSYNNRLGLVEGEKDSSGNYINSAGAPASNSELNSRIPVVPFQNISHNKVTLVNRFVLPKGELAINVGYQMNDRKEYSASPDVPGLVFALTTIPYDIKYFVPEMKGYELVIGAGGMHQINTNKGQEFLIPDYSLNDFGGFIYAKKSLEKLTINAGVRLDNRSLMSEGLISNGDTLFSSFNKNFSAVSGSAGVTYEFSRIWSVKANVGRAFRAPSIPELSANGVHEGTFRYERGSKDLKPETSLQLDASIKAQTNRVEIQLNGFRNSFSNFIYYRNSGNQTITTSDGTFPLFVYTQGPSLMQGFEFSIDAHIFTALHFENNFSYVHAENADTKTPLPFIPPASMHNELKYEFKSSKTFTGPYASLSIDNHFHQNRIDEFETTTGGYSLLNASLGSTIKIAKQNIFLAVIGNNLLDTKYYDHLNRLKYKGIYNMGRNITISINIPINSKKQ